ncbi:MAG TPA: ribose-5-phosphate isomerase RpiA [Spirochaetia bacterium]|nr:ribose-5-phosphate isomerase RpiA [Spirochaetia bacterium]
MKPEEIKALVGRTAADQNVRSGMKVGMGTGSTAVWAIRRIGELVGEGSISDILVVPTSFQSTIECQKQKLSVRSLNDPDIGGMLDVTIDGADEVDGDMRLTKGGGAALLIEKLVAYNSEQVVIVVDESKLVEHLGLSFAIPIEVHPEARVAVSRALERIHARGELRMALRKMGPVITDNGNLIIDATLESARDPVELESLLNSIPGVMENGLFTRCSPIVYVADAKGTVRTLGR